MKDHCTWVEFKHERLNNLDRVQQIYILCYKTNAVIANEVANWLTRN